MMKKITLLVALVATMGIVNAQSTYKRAIGIRVSPVSYYDIASASFKTFVTKAGAIELNAGFGSRYYGIHSQGGATLSVSGAYQHHFDIKPVAGLKWFVGGGASILHTFSKDDDFKGVGAGLFATGGVDYKFKKIPLNVSADYRPTVLLARPKYYSSFRGEQFGLAARYTF